MILYIMLLTATLFYEILFPRDSIDIAVDFNCEDYMKNPDKFGKHIYNVR